MEDQYIFRIAFITSIIGLVGMVFFAGQIMPREVKITDINRGMLDEDVAVEGVVEDIGKSKGSNTYFLDIMDGTGKITLIIFDSTATDLQKDKNLSVQSIDKKRVSVVGTVSDYKGNTELILKDSNSLKIIS